MTSPQDRRRAIVRELLAALDDHDTDTPRDLFGPAYDVEGLIDTWSGLIAAFPDLGVTVHELGVDDQWVIARFHLAGTHDGAFWGIAPTGRSVAVQEHVSYRVVEDAIVETHATFDGLDLLTQLGVDLPIDR